MTNAEIIRHLQKQLEEVWFENIELNRRLKQMGHTIVTLRAQLKQPWYKRIFK